MKRKSYESSHCVFAICAAALLVSFAGQPADAGGGPSQGATAQGDFDAGGGLRVGTSADIPLAPARAAALEQLKVTAGKDIAVTLNAVNGAPRTLVSSRPLSAPSGAPAEMLAKSFLRTHKAVWGFSEAEIDALKLDAQYTDRHNGVTHVFYVPTVGGVPVFPASLSVHLSGRGEVLSVQGDVFPGLADPGPASLTPEQAAEIAADHIGVAFQAQRSGEQGAAVVLDQGPFLSEIRVTRAIYALLGDGRLAYRMILDKSGLEWYDILVDAATGEILHRRNLYVNDGALSPSSPPAEDDPAAPRGLVYTEHALATVRGTGDLVRTYPYTADPLGRPRGFANAPLFGADFSAVIAHGGNPDNATIAQTLLPLPDAANPVRSNAMPLSTSPQSPEGWFVLQGGEYVTFGNNVDAKDDQAADNEAAIGQRANGGVTGDFSGPAFVFQNFHGQNGPYADLPARQAGAAPDLPAVVLNLFYICNWYHDFLHHLGFTEPAGNFQLDNFGQGGAGNDHVLADAQDGSGTDNANFGTPPDGSKPRMQMFLFTSPDRDGDLDADIIIHEYTHGVSNRLVGGPNNTSCLGVGLVGESGSMGEGWGDWYAAVIFDEPVVAEYSVNAGVSGIRRFPMDAGPNDFTYGFLCTGPLSDPSLVPCEVHDGGEFWTIVLWEMREAMINRFHNRAFPDDPFPTFTGDLPAGNIRNAQGRTFDGSNTAAQTDYVTIENASFTALFRVTDAMKLAPCNPTMVNMRDAILQADLNMGGEFRDLIWRAFANRGVGETAFSTGGQALVIVEDFVVPQTVLDCEEAGGPLAAPEFTAVSVVDNTVDITIAENGAAEYIIYRGLAGEGSPIDPTAFIEVARTAATVYTDAGLDGGVTYYYRVRAARNDDCVSDSNVASVVPLGDPLPCTVDPSFAGLLRVIDPGDCQHLLLDWAPATSNCAGGQGISYNIYRSTDPQFVPDAGNRIATGVPGNSFTDTPGELDTLFYYVVRAEDTTSGNGGPANDGNEDGNTVRKPGLVTSATLINQGFTDDVETGPDNGMSEHFTSSGFTIELIPERGGWFRDDAPDPAVARSPVHVWHTFDPDNKSISPSGSLVYELTSDTITITPESILTFFHTFLTEPAFDGGVVEAALVDETTGLVGAFADIGHLIYENGYTGVLDAPGSDNALANRPAYTGGQLGPMVRSRAFLGGLVPEGNDSQNVIIRFLFGSDAANVITVPPIIEGSHFPGWYIDDVSIDEPCCPISAPPENLQAEVTGNNEITLTWDPPQGGGAIAQYLIFREVATEEFPTVFTNQIGTSPGDQTTFIDTELVAGLTYAYVVRAVPETGCPSGDSNIATATATGICNVEPTFAGLDSVTAPPQTNCTLVLSWSQGFANCPGATVRYNVYRSTDASFVPSTDNAIALGVDALSYTDQDHLLSGVTYYYIVRAEDSTTESGGPANGGNEDDNLVRRSGTPQGPLTAGPDFVDDVEPTSEPGYTTFSTRTVGGWTVLVDATAHSPTNAWVALDDQPGVPTLTQKDDRLTLPALNLTSTSLLTFWHNFDFAQFPEIPLIQEAEYHSGGILEISADGDAWVDLGPHITGGGYNGVVASGAQSPLTGRMAWIGSSDGTADAPIPGRVDAMQEVVVDLGAAISDPDTFNATTLPGARVRFRLGGTFQILIGGIQGTGWGVDDITVSGLQAAEPCCTAPDCNTNCVVDDEDIGGGGAADCDDNLVPDECDLCGTCRGDVNADNHVDGDDVGGFVTCLFNNAVTAGCADMNVDGVVNAADVPLFIDELLNDPETECP